MQHGRAKVDGQGVQFSVIPFLLSPYWHVLDVSILAGQANDDFLLGNEEFQRSYSSEIVHPMRIVESSTSERSLATMSKKRVKYRLCANVLHFFFAFLATFVPGALVLLFLLILFDGSGLSLLCPPQAAFTSCTASHTRSLA